MTHFRPEGKGGLGKDDSRKEGRSKGSEQRTMRTYSHGVIGYLLYAKRPRHEQRLAIIGSILPDVFLALGFVAHYGAIVTQSPLVSQSRHNAWQERPWHREGRDLGRASLQAAMPV